MTKEKGRFPIELVVGGRCYQAVPVLPTWLFSPTSKIELGGGLLLVRAWMVCAVFDNWVVAKLCNSAIPEELRTYSFLFPGIRHRFYDSPKTVVFRGVTFHRRWKMVWYSPKQTFGSKFLLLSPQQTIISSGGQNSFDHIGG